MSKPDYNKLFLEAAAKARGERRRVLVHACCAPCTAAAIGRLTGAYDAALFYFNPNITAKGGEWQRRLDNLRAFAAAYGEETGRQLEVVVPAFEPEAYFTAVQGLEKEPEGGKRCAKCIYLRLLETAQAAKRGGFDCFCTTLTSSANKNAEMINETGAEIANSCKIEFLAADFKKDGGALISKDFCTRYGIYRQNFCGCNFK